MAMDYAQLARQARALAEADPWYVPLMANVSALLFDAMDDLNWAGFYVVRGGRLVLGPFQGRPACIHIEPGRGVCGTSLAEGRTIRVEDVHAFPGHIACDAASNSEIVVPLRAGGRIAAVLDIDSPSVGRFSAADQAGLEDLARALEDVIRFD